MFLESVARPYIASRRSKESRVAPRPGDDPNCLGSILIFSHLFPRAQNRILGGFVHEQARALQRLGYRVYVLSGEPLWVDDKSVLAAIKAFPASWETGIYIWEQHEGVPFLRFPYPVGARHLSFPAHAASYTLAALKCLSVVAPDIRFDLIHAHTSYTDGTAATLCGRIYDKPVVITEHTGPFSHLTAHPIVRYLTDKAVSRCNALITVSSALLTDMKRGIAIRSSLETATIPNIVDTNLFVFEERGTAREQTVMLWVGHFTKVKRVDRLLRALALAVRTNDRLMLRLVGHGEQETELKVLTSALGLDRHVEFVGPAARHELPGYFREADFTVVSSDTETFSVVAIESLSCGRPVLATKCGGPEDIISDEQSGLLVEKNETDLAQGMIEVMNRLRSYDGAAISGLARQRYSHDAVGRQLKAVYDRLLGPTVGGF